ncbi:metallophosphoesterase family protein [Amylibacter sp. IMCC11727]|uniref:metallophosphoesterase family protein n=1 Tax=Amylibacter sp. IMCC11727 TaxID=3039851 RepID=UPI00244DC199|nr:metallophosphoesterase family protein [Amylibacter sp. IMCC11727]WGI20313.1 metallophosphoesterase family protein [Amylibacter sp. IMCC11727]
MRIQDLGVMTGEILLFGGIYSNLPALDALLSIAMDRGIKPQNMICTGDVVAYCADAEASVARLRALGCLVLSGNCEVQLAQDADDCGCGFEEGSTCSALSARWYAHAKNQVTLENKVWMSGLPERIIFTHEGRRYAVVHGGASDIATFVWPVTSDADIQREIDLVQTQVGPVDTVIAGHTGIAMDKQVDGVRWINSGAVGMPPNDGDARGAFAILSGNTVQFERLTYDTETAHQAMIAAGLTQGYHETLVSGFWPSEETLPPEMRRQSSANG